MIAKGSRVRHKDKEIDKIKGVMAVLEIKNGYAVCGYSDFERYGKGIETYPLTDLKLGE
ncbi:hypothetical protein IM793_12735 [Pedobacter sp. MR2016-19]|uniref:hypothetical protein n=1 Tax=Pedobacter sp. MR2016-19 TaxID=2780089 RepID=UPI0018749DD8|nr:hypothetical protein [Pedobacter sp. MR2016-19]MBE5320031.1 hypothetical protein [Pedobacter sp. MR2016-19]